MTKIAIGIGTANRPKMLSQTLESLVLLNIPSNTQVEILLLDNAPDQPVKSVVDKYAKSIKIPLHYLQQSKKGIVAMRNTIVDKAIDMNFDFLAFIDDDETVSENWLEHMVKTQEKYHADVVSGRTLRELPENTPDHIKTFYKKGSRPTGIQRPTSSTCNVLFDLKKLCVDWGMRFDMRLNFVGSSDILFFNQAHKKGARIIWCEEAVVTEIIPESRANEAWLLQRYYRIGNTMAVRYKIQNMLLVAYFKGFFYAVGEYIVALQYKMGLKKNSNAYASFISKKRHLNIARGILNGLFGPSVFEEYKEKHGF